MQPVPRPVLIAGVVAAALAVALIAASSVDRGGARAPEPGPHGVVVVHGRSLQSARCSQWRAATPAQRRALTRVLAATVGGPSGSGRGTTLPGDRAAALFDRACASPVARHFLLYELYTRAAAFNVLAPPPPAD